jgi:hypothetical protein
MLGSGPKIRIKLRKNENENEKMHSKHEAKISCCDSNKKQSKIQPKNNVIFDKIANRGAKTPNLAFHTLDLVD